MSDESDASPPRDPIGTGPGPGPAIDPRAAGAAGRSTGDDHALGLLRASIGRYPDEAKAQSRALTETLSALTPEIPADVRGAVLDRAVGLAHKLAGSGGSMGFPAVGRAAAALEILLERLQGREAPLSVEVCAQVDRLAARLDGRVEAIAVERSTLLIRPPSGRDPAADRSGVGGGGGAGDPGRAPRTLVLIGALPDDPWSALSDRLRWYGWRVETVADADDLAAADPDTEPAGRAQAEPPALVLVDLDTVPDGLAIVARLTADGGPWAGVPWYGAEAQPSARVRARAAAAGCAGVLTKPVGAEALVDHHDAVCAAAAEESPRVVILDPDPAIAAMLRHVLEAAGALASVANGPDAVLRDAADGATEGGVDAVVLVERAEAQGAVDLAMALRQDPACDVPGLVLVIPTPELDPVAGVLAQGGDVLLASPLEPDLFTATVLGQAARARGRRRRACREGAGPVLVRQALMSRLARLLGRAMALDLSLTVAALTLRGSDPDAAPADDTALARLLRVTLRSGDLIGRGPDDTLAVVMPATTRAEAEARLSRLPEAVAHLMPGRTVAIGLASTTDETPSDPTAAAVLGAAVRAVLVETGDP